MVFCVLRAMCCALIDVARCVLSDDCRCSVVVCCVCLLLVRRCRRLSFVVCSWLCIVWCMLFAA